MSRRRLSTLPLRLWLALALIAIVGAPALTTWTLSVALAPRLAPGEVAMVATVRRLMGDDPARWRDPAWQREARRRLAELHIDIVLDDAAGRQVFATSSDSTTLWGFAFGSHLRAERLTTHPLSPRTVMTFPLFHKLPAGHKDSTTFVHMRLAAALVGVAVVAMPVAPTPRPPAWLVPLAGLVALLVTLAVVAWGLGAPGAASAGGDEPGGRPDCGRQSGGAAAAVAGA